MYPTLSYITLTLMLVLFVSCREQTSGLPEIEQTEFTAYWDQGKAEISGYVLNQSIFGEQHEGSCVLVYMTEEMSKSKEVKLDDPVRNSSDAVKVLKLNTIKEFVTGINKYSMMSSVFTPVAYEDHPRSLKFTASCQEWSGQTFVQFNWKGNRYEIQQMSYVESEGDNNYSLVSTWLEDEIWTKVRVAPNTLPLGEVTIIPSAFYFHLSGQPVKAFDAIASLFTSTDKYTYTIHYPEINRTISIDFEKVFPYKILGWKESYGNNEVTSAHITQTIISDYWNHGHAVDENMRQELQLK